MIKNFRGLLANDTEDRIRLSTIKGKVGYRIIKLEVIPALPYGATAEHVLKIYKEEQSSITVDVNFTDSALLATAIINNDGAGYRYPSSPVIIFDSEVFNQDIYASHKCADGTTALNYYLELEVIPLDDAGAEYTTLKDMRST